MRHGNSGRQFGRNSSHRRALFRNLVTSFLEHGHIETTEAKAKEIRGIAEKMITLGKRGDLHAKRQALAFITNRDVVAKLFSEIGPRVANRDGGYTRIIKTRVRLGDSAPMAILEMVDEEGQAAPAAKPKREKKAPVVAAAQAAPAAAPEAPAAEEAKAEAATEAAEEAPAPEAEAPAEGEEQK